MIPALLAVPAVEGVVGSVAGSVASMFAPSTPAATPLPFNPYLNRAAAPAPSVSTATAGMLSSRDIHQMTATQASTWANGLAGRHVDATDASGRTFSGVVNGIQQPGHNLALNVNGHLVSLSQIKQISWSSATV